MVEYKHTGGAFMNTREVIYELRRKKGLSQDELAEKVYVTRQAVSRWETGETVPNTETQKLLSNLFSAHRDVWSVSAAGCRLKTTRSSDGIKTVR